MRHNKPDSNDINTVWGSSSTPENLQRPDDDYIHDGWLQVKPPYQIENWSMNKLHQFVAYLNQRGIPEWDSNTEYFIDSAYVMGDDGRVYKCIQTNTGNNPTTNGNSQYWELTSWDRYATTAKAGIARKATPAQVLAGTDNDAYVTPATYRSSLPEIPTPPDATQGNRGMIEIATQNETDRGDDDLRAVTPQKLRGYRDNVVMPVAAPTGVVQAYAGTTAPAGWLECNGREYLRSEYATLFTVIGTRFGSGNGSTSFNIPDLRGEFIRGWDNGRGVDGNRTLGSSQSQSFQSHTHSGRTSSDGNHSHSASTSTEGNHSHSGSTNTTGDHTHGMAMDDRGGSTKGGWGLGYGSRMSTSTYDTYGDNEMARTGNHSHSVSTNTTGNHRHTVSIGSNGSHSHSFTTGTENTGGGSETRPRNVSMMYIIKT